MDFDLDDQQRLIDSSLRVMLRDRLPLERLRLACEKGDGFDPELWEALCDIGMSGLIIPESYGGSGLGILDCVVVAEAMGHAALPTPFLSTMVMAPLAVKRLGNPMQQEEILPQFVNGDLRAAFAFETAPGTNVNSTLQQVDDTLSGRLEGVLDGAGASHLLIQRSDGRAALVDLQQAGVEIDLYQSLDRSRPLANVVLKNVSFISLSSGLEGAAAEILQIGRLMVAADILGAAQYMFDAAIAYAQERTQFDRVIGSFQGLKHVCAEMVSMLEPCRALVWYAGHAFDQQQEETPLLAHHAKAHLSEIGREISRMATEIHGGMGFTDLLGLHIWFKRIAQNRQLLGTPEHCRRDAARIQGWVTA